MGVLDNNPSVTESEMIAKQIKYQARICLRDMARAFNSETKLLWTNEKATPSEISTALGSDAKEIFDLYSKLQILINSIKPETISNTSSTVGSFTMNEDGTVTIN